MSKQRNYKFFLIFAILAAALMLALALPSCTKSGKTDDTNFTTDSEGNPMDNGGGVGLPDNSFSGMRVAFVKPLDAPAYYDDVVKSVKTVGAAVSEYDWNTMGSAFDAAKNDVVIIADASQTPNGIGALLDAYLKSGGRVLTIGGPLFENIYMQANGTWSLRDDVLANLASSPDMNSLLSFNSASDAAKWQRSTSNPETKATRTQGDFGCPGGGAMQVQIDNFVNWELVAHDVTIPAGDNCLGLYLKGDAQTTSMSVEIREADGSRWIAAFPITADWKYYVLSESDFTYWADNSSVGRGGYGDHLNMSNGVFIQIGLALSSTTSAALGPHTFWVGPIGTINYVDQSQTPPVIDQLSPAYKYFPVTNGASLVTSTNQIFVTPRDYTLPSNLISVSPRPQGNGYQTLKTGRFVPLIEINDSRGLRSGYAAWMYINDAASGATNPYEGSVLAGIGTDDPAFFDTAGLAAVNDIVRALLQGTYIVEGGADQFLYVDSDTASMSLGAEVNGKSLDKVNIDIKLFKDKQMIYQKQVTGFDSTQRVGTGGFTYDLSSGKPDSVTVSIIRGDRVVDRVTQPITFWSPKAEADRKYITMSGNEFMQNGQPLRLYGVNYMPSSGIAVNPDATDYFEHYISMQSFDPDVVVNDLKHIKDIGFNAVSLFVYHDDAMVTNNMIYLISICESMGIYVDLSLRPSSDPMNGFDAGQTQEMITQLHLPEIDDIVAYDIAWERDLGTYSGSYGNAAGRQAYDTEWEQWIYDNYGSVSAAEAAWGVSVPDVNGQLTGPSDDMIANPGQYSDMVIAYRRFADELVGQSYAAACNVIRAADPNHLISARLGSQGGVPLADVTDMGYDLLGVAAGLDFASPEGYAITATDASMAQIQFTNAYARYAMPGAPVVWKEYGQQVWSGSNFAPSTQALQNQANYYSMFLDQIISAHTGAAYCWWYAGGYRTNENSDFGVVNPDGSDRPVTQVLRDHVSAFMGQPALTTPDTLITANRNDFAAGIQGMYNSILPQISSAVSAGQTFGLTDGGAGKTTADADMRQAPLIAGSGDASATNPARFVGATFADIYVLFGDGTWHLVTPDSTTVLSNAGDVQIKVSVVNMGVPWQAAGAGSVSLSVDCGGTVQSIPLTADVPYLGQFTATVDLGTLSGNNDVVLRMQLDGLYQFGMPFRLSVKV